MNSSIRIYNNIVTKVSFLFNKLKIKVTRSTGRPLSITPEDTVALALFKQTQGIETKKSAGEMFEPKCSYKTLVVNMNKLALHALVILQAILPWNQRHAPLIKHTDSTDIPVCLAKNGKYHKTMKPFAPGAHGPKGWYYGLKMSITPDLKKQLLAVRLGTGNSNDRETFKAMNKDMTGIFVADAGYISKDLEREFYLEHKRILFVKPRANMKKLATEWQIELYETRMLIELNFRSLKMFSKRVTSLPRSIDGYRGNYVYSLLAFVLR